MPELPEVECLTRAVREVLKGGRIHDFSLLRADLRDPIPDERLRRVLVGHRIDDVFRRSKYMLVRTVRGFGVFHLGMTGNMFFEETPKARRKHTHAIFHVVDGRDQQAWLHFVDPRRFGRIDAVEGEAQELGRHPSFAELGPEPLEAAATDLGEHLFQISRKRKAPVKSFLMDQRVVVGVGNIYANEALFRAGIHPAQAAGAISRMRFDRLAERVRETLQEAIAAGGTSVNDYRHVDGERGYFQVKLNVYDREGEACLICGTRVRMLRQSGRSTYYCGKCQRH